MSKNYTYYNFDIDFLREDEPKKLGYTPMFDFEKKKIEIQNGSPHLKNDIDAIKQWITLFFKTPKDAYKIYFGTDFGTSIRQLFGKKRLNNGYEEAIVERETKEGLLLCPLIKNVRSFNLSKQGRDLYIEVEVELLNEEYLTVKNILEI